MNPTVALEELFLATASILFRTPRGARVWAHRARDGWVLTDEDHLHSPMRLYDPTSTQCLFQENGELNWKALEMRWLDRATGTLTLSRALELAGGPVWAPLIPEIRALEEKYMGRTRIPTEVVGELRAWAALSGEVGEPLGGSTPSLTRTAGGITVRVDPSNSSLEVTRAGDPAPCLRTNLQGVMWTVHTTWPEVHAELTKLTRGGAGEPPTTRTPAAADPWLRGAPFPYERGAYWLYQKHPGGHWSTPSLVTVFKASTGEWTVGGLYAGFTPVDSLYEPRFLPLGEVPSPPAE